MTQHAALSLNVNNDVIIVRHVDRVTSRIS